MQNMRQFAQGPANSQLYGQDLIPGSLDTHSCVLNAPQTASQYIFVGYWMECWRRDFSW